ncbi:MAG: tetratricopeptide repeat protein [Chlamydiae bacterium]|nr:tetratricopeptide repeat protein [Chlamydiota bacterium]
MNPLLRVCFLLVLLFFSSCSRVPEELHPKIQYCVQEQYLQSLSSPFSPLHEWEKNQDWGKEYMIGLHFAKNLDLYRAITAFKRAEILIPSNFEERKLEIEYEILLCYYLGKKYEEVEQFFCESKLQWAKTDFPAFHDLLLILHDTYQNLGKEEKTCQIRQLIQQHYPQTYEKLTISTAMITADFPELNCLSKTNPYLENFLACYESKKKSIVKAKTLNMILPGAGYLYLGQTQTGITALLVNGLFIAAAVYFFGQGEVAAGIITSSFEAGWYFGGIYGAGHEAKFHNERLYEKLACPVMQQQKLFPVILFKYAF